MTHIVVIGAGLGGMAGAYELRDQLNDIKITVVNERDYYQFVPSNPWIAVGWRKRNDISFPAAPYLAKKNIDFIAQAVNRIDAVNNTLHLANGEQLTYDYLVIATGPKLAFDEIMTHYNHYATESKQWSKHFDWNIIIKKYLEIIG